MNKEKLYLIFWSIILVTSFIVISYLMNIYGKHIQASFVSTNYGIILYFLIVVFSTVFAPVSAIPLMPVAVYLWGPLLTAIISIFAWTLGAMISFLFARRYGGNILKKFKFYNKIKKFENIIPKNNMFIGIILFRIFLPVDILSYAFGLFSNVSFLNYSLATFIGVIPFGFILAYLGVLPSFFQVIGFIIIGLILLYLLRKYYNNKYI